MLEHKYIEESPLRLEKKVKPSPTNNPVISSFQKNEALVLSDNSGHYSEWPTSLSNKLPGYKHKPIINKVVMKNKKDIDLIQKVMDSIRQCALAKSNKLDLKAVFKQFDTSGDGFLSKDEMNAALLSLNVNLDEDSMNSIYRYFDPNESGEVDFGEFIWTFFNRKRLNNTPTPLNLKNQKPIDMQKSLSKIKLKSKVVDKFSKETSKQQLVNEVMQPLTEEKESILEPIQVSNVVNIISEEDKLLYLAEQLLTNVTNCINPSVIAQSKIIPDEINTLLNTPQSIIPSHTMGDVDSHMTQIEWLLRGLPEVYDSEPHFDDETVEAILKEGGSPPTQLVLPSVYAVNQKVLNKLNTSKILRIKFNHLLVFSARYGLRKEGSYLVIHPPIGCIRPASQTATIMLPLSELQDADHQIAQLLRKNTKRDSMRNYFVGNVELDKKIIELKLLITDDIMREWINNTSVGCIKVEIFGYLAPRDAMIRGKLSEPVCIASTKIPLGGLLGTPSLDAILHCDLEVDISSHSSILSRMNNISFGQKIITKPKPLGTKLGTLTTRITLLSEEIKENNKKLDKNISVEAPKSDKISKTSKVLPGDDETSALLLPVIHKRDLIQNYDIDNNVSQQDDTKSNDRLQQDHIHNALAYIPSEPSNNYYNKYDFIDFNKFEFDNTRCIYGQNIERLNCNFGLVFCGITNLHLPIETIVNIDKSKLELETDPEIVISYKLNSSSSDQVLKSFNSLQTNNPCLLLSQTKLYQTDIDKWVVPILEIWLVWKEKSYDNNQSINKKKILLGLSKFPKEYKLKDVITLPIIDAMKSINRGNIMVSIHLESDIIKIQNSLLAIINKYQIDMKKIYPIDLANTNNFSVNKSVGNEIVINKVDEIIIPSNKIIDNNKDLTSNETNTMLEMNPLIDPIPTQSKKDATIDSIEDLCYLLNDYHQKNTKEIIHNDKENENILITNEFNESQYYEEILNSTDKLLINDSSIVNIHNQSNDSHQLNDSNLLQDNNNVNIEIPLLLKISDEELSHYTIPESILKNNLDNSTADMSIDMLNQRNSLDYEKEIHLIDFSIQGAFNYISLKSEALTFPHQIFGCYVCYHLKDCTSNSSSSLDININNRSIWWDGDCPVLNGSIRHKFEGNISSVDSLYDLLEIDIMKKGITFQLLSCDIDGNLSPDSFLLGEAYLSINILYNILKDSGCNTVLSIPIQFSDIDSNIYSFDLNNSSIQSNPMLNLNISHRIEPILLRKSVESTICKSNEVKQSLPSIDPEHNLLGFELTLQDLDNIHKLRDKFQNPIWIPFEYNSNHGQETNILTNNQSKTQLENQNSIQIASNVYNNINQGVVKDGKCFMPLEIVLEEYAHLNLDMSKLTKPSIVCTASAKVHPSFEINHSVMDTNLYSSSDAYLINPPSKNNENIIIPWKEPYPLTLKGILHPSTDAISHDLHDLRRRKEKRNDDDEEDKIENDNTTNNTNVDKKEIDINLLHLGKNSDYDDFSKILKGASVVVSLYLRQQLFTNTIYINNELSHNRKTNIDNKDSKDDDAEENIIKITDQFLGSAVIDISTLALGMPIILGWYHLIDDLHNCIGQIKVSIKRFSDQKILDQTSDSFIQSSEMFLKSNHIPISNDQTVESQEDLEANDQLCDASLLDLRGLAHDALKKSLEELQIINDRLLGNIYKRSFDTSSMDPLDNVQSKIFMEQTSEEHSKLDGDNLKLNHNDVMKIDSLFVQDKDTMFIKDSNYPDSINTDSRSYSSNYDVLWNEETNQITDFSVNFGSLNAPTVKVPVINELAYDNNNESLSNFQIEIQSFKDNSTFYSGKDIESYQSIDRNTHVISTDSNDSMVDNNYSSGSSSSYQCKEYETDEYMPDFESVSTATNEFYASRSGILFANEINQFINDNENNYIAEEDNDDDNDEEEEEALNSFIYADDHKNNSMVKEFDFDDYDYDERSPHNNEVEEEVYNLDEFEDPDSSSSEEYVISFTEQQFKSNHQNIQPLITEESNSLSDKTIVNSLVTSIEIIDSNTNEINITSCISDELDIKDNIKISTNVDNNTINEDIITISEVETKNEKDYTQATPSVSIDDSNNSNNILENSIMSNSNSDYLANKDSIHSKVDESYISITSEINNNLDHQNDYTDISNKYSSIQMNHKDETTESYKSISKLDNHSINTSMKDETNDSYRSNIIDEISESYKSSSKVDTKDSYKSVTMVKTNNSIKSINNIDENNNQDDSPNTTKIKVIIDQEIERIFGIEIPNKINKSNEENLNNSSIFKIYKESKDIENKYNHISQQSFKDDTSINNINEWNKSNTATMNNNSTSSNNTIHNIQSDNSKDLLHKNMVDIQTLLPTKIINDKAMKNSINYPIGKQRKFIDDETNRISNIMMNVMHKKHS